MSNLLETLKLAHDQAGKEKVNDPRMNTILGHINQAIGILDPAAAGQARAIQSKAVGVLQQGRFGTTPPPQTAPANINPYDLPKKKDVLVVEQEDQAQETTDHELIEAKAQHGQLKQVDGNIVEQLSSLSVQEIAKKYNKEQLSSIAGVVSADIEGMRSLKQIAAAIKTAIAK